MLQCNMSVVTTADVQAADGQNKFALPSVELLCLGKEIRGMVVRWWADWAANQHTYACKLLHLSLTFVGSILLHFPDDTIFAVAFASGCFHFGVNALPSFCSCRLFSVWYAV